MNADTINVIFVRILAIVYIKYEKTFSAMYLFKIRFKKLTNLKFDNDKK